MSPFPLHGAGGGTAYPFAPLGWDKEEPRPSPRRRRPRAGLIEIVLRRLDPGRDGRLIVGAKQQEA